MKQHSRKAILTLLTSCFLPAIAHSAAVLTFTNNSWWYSFGYQVTDVDYQINPGTPEQKDYYLRLYPSKVDDKTCKVVCEVNDTRSYFDLVNNPSRSSTQCTNFQWLVNPYPSLFVCGVNNGNINWPAYDDIKAKGDTVKLIS